MRDSPEGRVVDAVLAFLKLKNVFAWRNNSGATVAGEGASRRFVRYGLVGSSDILGILPDGQFLGIECKSPTGRTTKAQEAFLDEIEGRGGLAILARDVNDVLCAFGKYRHGYTWRKH